MTEIEVIILPVFSYVMTFVFDEKMIEIGATTVPVVSCVMILSDEKMTEIAATNFPIFSKAMGFVVYEK